MFGYVRTVILVALALTSSAARSSSIKTAGPEKASASQLEQALAAARGESDADVAQRLAGLELKERLSTKRLERLSFLLTGEKSQQALTILADQSAFLDPPEDEIVAMPTPDGAATRQMLVKIVDYVNTTIHQMPNFIATRVTTGFEDRPQEDVQEATAVISYSYLPLHVVGKSSATLTYRDGHEVMERDATASASKANRRPQVHGLATEGEFGPILSTVVRDALKGKIIWARWERSGDDTEAVFHYIVPKEKSNYVVKFCCVSDSLADGLRTHVSEERAGYHGDIAFDPATGAIRRMTLEAEVSPGELVSRAAISMEFGPVEIGGKSYVCPTKSVSLLLAHTAQPRQGMHMAGFEGIPKTFLNDVHYDQYRRFGSESRILPGDGAEMK